MDKMFTLKKNSYSDNQKTLELNFITQVMNLNNPMNMMPTNCVVLTDPFYLVRDFVTPTMAL